MALGFSEAAVPLSVFGATFFPSSTLLLNAFSLDAAGRSSALWATPALDSSLCGSLRVVQAAVFDPSAMGGVRFTNGVRLQAGVPVGPLFPTPRFEIAEAPSVLCVGDFDDDNAPDLLSAGGGGLVVLRNVGEGEFEETQRLPLGASVRHASIAELTGDGVLDVVVATGGLTLLPGNGDGTFGGPIALPTPVQGASRVEVADLDGDATPDLLVGGGTQVSFLRGNGDGTFGLGGNYWAASQVHLFELVDINNDALLDVLVSDPSFPGASLRVLLGNGDGSFATQYRAWFLSARDLAVGDLNGDGWKDICSVEDFGKRVEVLKGRADGGFDYGIAVSVPRYAEAVELIDLDADGLLDVVASCSVPGQVAVALGNGDATFGVVQVFTVGQFPWHLVVDDLNGDGVTDVAVADYWSSDVSILLGDGNGAFEEIPSARSLARADELLLEDLDADGRLDLITGGDNFPPGLDVHIGSGDGTFALTHSVQYAGHRAIRAGHVDADGVVDLVAITDAALRGLVVLLGQGDGTFASPIESSLSARAIDLGDVDGDGLEDLVAILSGAPNDTVSIQRALGDGRFAQIASQIVPQSGSVQLADLDGDGDLDTLSSSRAGLFIMWNNGDGTLASTESYSMGISPTLVCLADLNGDGRLDLVATEVRPSPNELAVRLASGVGDFGPLTREPIAYRPSGLWAHDVDGDGWRDVVALTVDSFVVHRGLGNGSFKPEVRYTSGGGTALGLGDVDLDGTCDVLVGNPSPAPQYRVHLGRLGE